MEYFEIAKQFFVGGIQLLQENNLEGAEAQFARSLEILPGRVSTLNNLAGVKLKLQKFAEAETCARQAIELEDKSPEAWANLGVALAKTGRNEEALTAYDRALQANGALVSAWVAKAEALLELKRCEEALKACDRALTLGPDQPEVLYVQSLALKALGQMEDAREAYTKSLALRVAKSPVHVSPRRATQKCDVLIINPDPCLDDELKPFETLQLASPNFPAQAARLFQDDFHFSFVFKGEVINPATRVQIPRPDVVINNCTNGEELLSDGSLAEFVASLDQFDAPVVNHPMKAAGTGREATARLLENSPGIRVPKTRRFSAAGKTSDQLAAEIEAQFAYPLITRRLTSQQGFGMTKVDSREALTTVLSTELPEEFFVTEFVDSRGGSQFYRKLRASIVQGEIVIMRVDHDRIWKIYGRKTDERVEFYRNNAQLLASEKQICADPETELGRSVMHSLLVIRELIPLEVFGVDFDVDADGLLVFYEANATMNLFSTARAEIPYPPEAEERFKHVFLRYLQSLGQAR